VRVGDAVRAALIDLQLGAVDQVGGRLAADLERTT
jgi:hypothetical protein